MARQSKASAASTTRAERAVFVMEKKGKGWSFRRIATQLKISHQAVSDIYWEERAKCADKTREYSEVIDAARDDDLEILQQIIATWLPLATGMDVDEDGRPIINKEAAVVVLKALAQKAQLQGLNAATKTDITSNGQTVSAIGTDLSGYTDEDLAALEAVHRRAAERQTALPAP